MLEKDVLDRLRAAGFEPMTVAEFLGLTPEEEDEVEAQVKEQENKEPPDVPLFDRR